MTEAEESAAIAELDPVTVDAIRRAYIEMMRADEQFHEVARQIPDNLRIALCSRWAAELRAMRESGK